MLVCAHRDEDADADIHLFLIQKRDAAADVALGLKLLDPPPAGRRGQPDTFGDVGHRETGVRLKDSKNPAIYGVDRHSNFFPMVSMSNPGLGSLCMIMLRIGQTRQDRSTGRSSSTEICKQIPRQLP